MTARLITLSACHEACEFVVTGLTGGEAALLERVAALSKVASQYECMPVMSVQQPAEPDSENPA